MNLRGLEVPYEGPVNWVTVIFYILSFVIFTVTLIMIMPFVSIYTRGFNDVNYSRYSIAILFTIMGLLNCIRTPGATIINAGGFYKETKNRALIEMFLCIIFYLINKLIQINDSVLTTNYFKNIRKDMLIKKRNVSILLAFF